MRKILVLLILIYLSPIQCHSIGKVDSLRVQFATAVDDKSRATTYLQISDYYFNTDLDSAIIYADLANEIAVKSGFMQEMAKASIYRGIAEAMKGNSEKVFALFNNAMDIYVQLNDEIGISNVYNNMGIVYNMNGNLPMAMESYKKALDYLMEGNDSLKMIPILSNIGVMYCDQKEYELSRQYTQRSYHLAKILGDSNWLAINANNIGNIYLEKNELDSAALFYNEALRYEIENKNKFGIGHELNKLGEIELLRKNYDEAFALFFDALKNWTEINSNTGICETTINIGKTYFAKKDLKQAEIYCLKGIGIAEEIGEKTAIREGSLTLSSIYEELGNFQNAYFYHKKFHAIDDSIMQNNNLKKITQLSMEYEFQKQTAVNDQLFKVKMEKQSLIRNSLIAFSIFTIFLAIVLFSKFRHKRKVNIALEERNRIISEQQVTLKKISEELIEANNTKNKFFSIIAHDIKNPFNLVLGFSSILKSEYYQLSDDERKLFISEINNASARIFDLLENLLTWANGQQGRLTLNIEKLDVSELLENSLSPYMAVASEKSIEVSQKAERDIFVFADKTTISICLSNIFNNAIKFTPEGGKIEIVALQNQGVIEIRVTDNGVGMNQETVDKLFRLDKVHSTPGTKGEKGTGLGLILCKDFIDKNNGKIEVISSPGEGSTFIVSLKNDDVKWDLNH
jgi:signal transduction histidine kinase/Tfp pilus assembly protein PilF